MKGTLCKVKNSYEYNKIDVKVIEAWKNTSAKENDIGTENNSDVSKEALKLGPELGTLLKNLRTYVYARHTTYDMNIWYRKMCHLEQYYKPSDLKVIKRVKGIHARDSK